MAPGTEHWTGWWGHHCTQSNKVSQAQPSIMEHRHIVPVSPASDYSRVGPAISLVTMFSEQQWYCHSWWAAVTTQSLSAHHHRLLVLWNLQTCKDKYSLAKLDVNNGFGHLIMASFDINFPQCLRHAIHAEVSQFDHFFTVLLSKPEKYSTLYRRLPIGINAVSAFFNLSAGLAGRWAPPLYISYTILIYIRC